MSKFSDFCEDVRKLAGEVDISPYAVEPIMWTDKEVRHRQLALGQARKLLETMPEKGATDEEINRAAAFTVIVLDAREYSLDWHKAKNDLGIRALRDKYSR